MTTKDNILFFLRVVRWAFHAARCKSIINGKLEGFYIGGQVSVVTREKGVATTVSVPCNVLVRPARRKDQSESIAVIELSTVFKSIIERKKRM